MVVIVGNPESTKKCPQVICPEGFQNSVLVLHIYIEGSFATWWAHSSNCDYMSRTWDMIQHFEPENQSKKGWFEPRKHWGCLAVLVSTCKLFSNQRWIFVTSRSLSTWWSSISSNRGNRFVPGEQIDVSCAGGFQDVIEGLFVYCIYIYICNMLRIYSMSILFSISKRDIFIDTFWEW